MSHNLSVFLMFLVTYINSTFPQFAHWYLYPTLYCKGPFTHAIFVAATRCNFFRAKIASSFKHVRNPCDIAATNRTKIALGLHVRF